MIDLANCTIEKVHDELVRGAYTVSELCSAYLESIKKQNETLNVYLEVYDDVLSQAKLAEERFKNKTATVLTGIPFALKDNLLVKGQKVSAGSKILEGYVAPYDSTAVRLLKEAGAVIIGRTNMDEFAMGSSTENSAFGVTKNPFDTSRVPGGSSGGSAAAVAAHMTLVALGSDTGGSIRQPAAFCGLVGFKPTYGSISRYGLIAMASSLDQIGPFTKTVADSEIIFKTLSVNDPKDSTSLPETLRNKTGALKKRLGVPKAFLEGEGIEKEVLANFRTSLDLFKNAGYEIVDVEFPLLPYSLPVYYILMPAEASTNLSRFDGIRFGFSKQKENLFGTYAASRGEGFGPEVRRRILLGTYVLSHGYYDAYYNKAVLVRKEIEKEFKTIFETVDAVITPTTPTSAFTIGEKAKDPVSMYLSDIFTVPANIAGIPAISIPSGFDTKGLPLGVQLMGPEFRDDILFTIGKEFENLRGTIGA